MRITVNGEPLNIASKYTVKDLLEKLEIPLDRGIAVAINATVVSRKRFEEMLLSEGDVVEIIQATAGG